MAGYVALNHDDLGPTPSFPTMIKTLLILPFLAVLACGSATNSAPDVMNGVWCPIDSLTEYNYESPIGKVVTWYVHTPSNGGYSLELFEGTATPHGRYQGTFQTDTIISNFYFTLPQYPGTYGQAHGVLHFTFPDLVAGVPQPTWFWEFSQHSVEHRLRYIYTNHDFYFSDQWAVHLRLTWSPCYPT